MNHLDPSHPIHTVPPTERALDTVKPVESSSLLSGLPELSWLSELFADAFHGF